MTRHFPLQVDSNGEKHFSIILVQEYYQKVMKRLPTLIEPMEQHCIRSLFQQVEWHGISRWLENYLFRWLDNNNNNNVE
jgi:serine acetyltransferase